MNLYINYRNYFKVVTFSFLVLAAGLLFATAAFAQTASSNDISPELTSLAQDLGCNSKEACEAAFEADFSRGIELAVKHDVYDQETQKLAQTFKQEVLANLANVKSENFEEKFVEIAQAMISQKPNLARLLNLNKEEVEAAKVIVTQIKEEGVNLELCRKPAESLTKEQLIACLNASNKLAENKTVVKSYISEERFTVADKSNSMLGLQRALDRGEYSSLGAKTPDALGNICLKQGSPSECDDIASRYFGADGVKYLAQARQHVSSVAEKYLKQVDSFILTTPDGQTISGEDAIRDTCDQAFNSGNGALAKACGNFAVKNGFITQDDFNESAGFLDSMQGQNVNFSQCRKDPKSCEQFIPEGQREQFNAMQEMESIMKAEIGFAPEECEKGAINPEIGQRCFEGSQRALPRLESLSQRSPQIRRIINEIKGHISENEQFINKSQEFQQVFQSQGGPGGCKSPQECFAYCSDSAHGAECISFGAKHEVFSGQEAVNRFQEYSGHIGDANSFLGQGPYPGFQPGSTPPGQIPGFTAPGPGFAPPPGGFPPGFGGQFGGPSPECFAAIQSGDFVRAKEVCSVPGTTNLPPPQPIGDIQICPAMPTVAECPPDQEKVLSYSSPQCGDYYYCRPRTDHACPSGHYWTGSTCVPSGTDSGKTGCEQAGGTWDASRNYCQMPGATSCSSGQYWNGTACVTSGTDSATSCAQAGGTWDTTRNYCNMPGQACPYGQWWDTATNTCKSSTTTTCASGQYWNGSSCVSSGGSCGSYTSQASCVGVSGCDWRTSGNSGWCQQATTAASCGNYICESGETTSCPSDCATYTTCSSGQYWDGTACVTSTSGGTGCGSSTAQASQSSCLAAGNCTWFNNACSPSTSTTTCPSGYYMGSNGTCVVSTTTCPSGQHWYTPSSGAGYCVSDSTGTCPSGQHMYNGACVADSTTTTTPTTCSSGQYWNGTACVTSTTTDTTTTHTCPSGQYWNGNACVTSTTTTPTTTCSSGQYWNGTACVSSCSSDQYWDTATNTCKSSTTTTTTTTTTPTCSSGTHLNTSTNTCESDTPTTTTTTPTTTTTTTTTTTDPAASCAQAGGTWASATSTCNMPSTHGLLPSSSVLAAMSGIVSQLLVLLQSLLR